MVGSDSQWPVVASRQRPGGLRVLTVQTHAAAVPLDGKGCLGALQGAVSPAAANLDPGPVPGPAAGQSQSGRLRQAETECVPPKHQ